LDGAAPVTDGLLSSGLLLCPRYLNITHRQRTKKRAGISEASHYSLQQLAFANKKTRLTKR
ncbi:MAG: hypothetical protein MUQ06_07185, partial [Burkholderiaceae bacterium]|nr:hypothetical protein [Burkholderiaceae bacterium]